MRHNGDDDSDTSDRGSETWDVPLDWIQQKIGRVVEIFVILQFVAGAFIFFLGIFLLMWAVVPSTSLQAGSYMLLAFYIIGRALLGLFGYYTDNFCLLFSYGALLVATFVVRTIMTLVRLKVSTNPEQAITIPPLLRAAPGAQSAPIELICSVLEFSQAFCSFYMCFIIVKTETLTKKLDEENKQNNSIIISNRFLQEAINSNKEQLSNEVDTSSKHEDELEDKKLDSATNSCSDKSAKANSFDLMESNKPKPTTSAPLKGILHQPSSSTYQPMTFELCTTQSHQQQIPFPSKQHSSNGCHDLNNSEANSHKEPFGDSHLMPGQQCPQHEPSTHHQPQHQSQPSHPPHPECQSHSDQYHHYANIPGDIRQLQANDQFVDQPTLDQSLDQSPKVPMPTNNLSQQQLLRSHHDGRQLERNLDPSYFEEYDSNNNPAWVASNFQFYRQAPPTNDNYPSYQPQQVDPVYPVKSVPVQYNAHDYMSLSPVKSLREPRRPHQQQQQQQQQFAPPRPMDLVLALSPTPPPELNQLTQSANSPLLYGHQNQNEYSSGNTFSRPGPNRLRRYRQEATRAQQPCHQQYPDYGSTGDYECPANLQFPP